MELLLIGQKNQSHYKMDIESIVMFLKTQLETEYVNSAFIFGSIAKGNSIPNDCDLFLITSASTDNIEWKIFINNCNKLKQDFYARFSLKLNTTINTIGEFKEGSDFKNRILNRPTIRIVDGVC